jgi:hypothetical protein
MKKGFKTSTASMILKWCDPDELKIARQLQVQKQQKSEKGEGGIVKSCCDWNSGKTNTFLCDHCCMKKGFKTSAASMFQKLCDPNELKIVRQLQVQKHQKSEKGEEGIEKQAIVTRTLARQTCFFVSAVA